MNHEADVRVERFLCSFKFLQSIVPSSCTEYRDVRFIHSHVLRLNFVDIQTSEASLTFASKEELYEWRDVIECIII